MIYLQQPWTTYMDTCDKYRNWNDKYIQFIGKATTYWVITYTLYKTHSIKILYKDRKGD